MPETRELTAQEKAARNDRIRQILPRSHAQDRVVYTRGIGTLGPVFVAEAMMRVRTFAEFTEDNDPYGEHDFGSFTLSTGGKCFWKIDDYAGYDGIRCVLTIMLADEY
jgi:hypothetical protein